jgi:hypothetical protein
LAATKATKLVEIERWNRAVSAHTQDLAEGHFGKKKVETMAIETSVGQTEDECDGQTGKPRFTS